VQTELLHRRHEHSVQGELSEGSLERRHGHSNPDTICTSKTPPAAETATSPLFAKRKPSISRRRPFCKGGEVTHVRFVLRLYLLRNVSERVDWIHRGCSSGRIESEDDTDGYGDSES
jgi:hypothetical protein